jgi:hypothetical protein
MAVAPYTNLSGCAQNFNDVQLIVFVGSDQKLYQLYWGDNKWAKNDIIANWERDIHVTPLYPKPGNGPRNGTPLALNCFEASQSSYLFYVAEVDGQNHIQVLPSPVPQGASVPPGGSAAKAVAPDLTERLGATAAMNGCPLTCYACEKQKSEHVIYVGEDGNVYEIYWTFPDVDKVHGGPLWQINPLSAHTGYTGPLTPKPGGPLVAYMFENEGTEHVVYIAKDNTIRELYYSGGKWTGNNLTRASGAKPPAANSPLAGYACEYENTQHVIYMGDDGDIHEIYNSQGWKPEHSLTQITNTSQPSHTSALVGYACEYERTEHVVYIANNSNIQELYRSGSSWYTTNLNSSSGSGAPPPVSPASPLAGYSFENQRTEHVVYLDANQQVHELYAAAVRGMRGRCRARTGILISGGEGGENAVPREGRPVAIDNSPSHK